MRDSNPRGREPNPLSNSDGHRGSCAPRWAGRGRGGGSRYEGHRKPRQRSGSAAVPLSGRRESYAERVDGPARPRIRWAWIAGCVVLGLAAIAAGWAIVLDANRTGYVAGVLANVGTTLLLVGIVVLLERRIVDTAVRAVRNANDKARRAARDDLDAQIRDLEERIRTSWGSGSVDAEGEGRRMTDEYSRRIADAADEYSRRIVDAEGGDAERD
jgi:hypothetical protein